MNRAQNLLVARLTSMLPKGAIFISKLRVRELLIIRCRNLTAVKMVTETGSDKCNNSNSSNNNKLEK
jgi:hypothetical protein